MTPTWEPVDPADVKPGDRVAPLATWTLDVLEIRGDVWKCLNNDTGGTTWVVGSRFKNLYRLVR